METTMLFSDRKDNATIISWNLVVLLHALLVQGKRIMQSPGKEVSRTYKSSLHTWRAY